MDVLLGENWLLGCKVPSDKFYFVPRPDPR